MGAAHSRARPGAGPAKVTKMKPDPIPNTTIKESNYGYFILCIKACDRIKIVNPTNPVLKLVTAVVKRHFKILKSGWDRHLAYSFKLQPSNRYALIHLTAEVLLTLYKNGWEPMTPIDLSVKGIAQNQTAICFRRETPEEDIPASSTPLSTSFEDFMSQRENQDCLCLETNGKNILGFHEVPNTILCDLVRCVQSEWSLGIRGISDAVSSVISDYTADLQLNVLPGEISNRKFIQLNGKPWSQSEDEVDHDDAMCAENLVLSIVACLARAQYKLQISIQMDKNTTVFFYIHDTESKDVRLPTFCGVGLGEKDGLYVYRPTITRNQTSFFRSRNGKGKSIRKRIRASFRRKSTKDKKKSTVGEAPSIAEREVSGKQKKVSIMGNTLMVQHALANSLETPSEAETDPDSIH